MAKQIENTPSETVVAMVQHSGQYGPWFHRSLYRVAPSTPSGYVFVERLGGHYNLREARESGLIIGRPGAWRGSRN